MGKKGPEEVAGQPAEGEEGGVGLASNAGYAFQAEIDLGFLDGVLAMLTPRAVPEEYAFGRALPARGPRGFFSSLLLKQREP